MNKERLEWVMSGLNQYKLTKSEDQLVKSAVEDFDKNHALTEQQEKKIETLYREKSSLTPDKKSPDYFTFKKSIPKKPRLTRPRTRVF